MRLLAVLGLFLALALAACGGDDGGASPTGAATAGATGTPLATPASSATPGVFPEQLSYISTGGAIHLVNPDGSGDRVFADAACESATKGLGPMAWSPDGTRLAYLCYPTSGNPTLIVRGPGGAETDRAEGVSYVIWSPDGSRIAYQGADGASVRLLSPGLSVDRTLRDNAILLDWAGPDSLLIGLDPVFGDYGTSFKAHLIQTATGEAMPVPWFDNQRSLWVTPDSSRAISITQAWNNGRGMAVYDFASQQETVIDGGFIGYPSDFVPHQQLAFSRDSSAVYWANAADAPTSVWTARLDTLKAQRLGQVNGISVAVSPMGRVAAVVQEGTGPGRLATVDPATSARAEVGDAGNAFAWRTTQP